MRDWQPGLDPKADERSAILLQSAISILTFKEAPTMAKKPATTTKAAAKSATTTPRKPATKWVTRIDEHSDEDIDNEPPEGIKSGFSVFNPVSRKDTTMARHPKHHAAEPVHESVHEGTKDFVNEEGYTETLNPMPVLAPTPQEVKAAAVKAKIEAKAAKIAAAAAKKAETEAKKAAREAEKANKVTATAEERAAKKAEREARIAALNPDGTRKYVGSMLALADRVKQGAYIKGATGQLRSTNELAEVLDAVPVDNVIQLAKIVLGLDDNPYINLNIGQQSMNLRNRMRGAIKKGTLTIQTIRETIENEGFATATDWAAERAAKKAAREARAAEAKAAKSAKEAEAAAKKAAAEAEKAAA